MTLESWENSRLEPDYDHDPFEDYVHFETIEGLEEFTIKACEALYNTGDPEALSDALESLCAILQIPFEWDEIQLTKKAPPHETPKPKKQRRN